MAEKIMELKEKFNIKDKKVKALISRIKEIGLKLSDIEEKITRGKGKGGQKINKTSNRVQLKHVPTGIMAASQRERERNKNRFLALRELIDKYEMKFHPEKSTKLKEIEKIRKKKARKKRKTRVKGKSHEK